ncbi:GH39 family glycosyl hydrolase [Paraliomyxa miuraensis]|uniref:GH39 family glycosyl hydrolase n=1 Tax=Paraliomyxa miuraensis TaxID=376150 RepID=UPI002251FEBF|nr:hypothetical protein [Paraliomyxa miuraensis]MCX4243152.1 hypothetical protein [Paraliomyxa miuraensis]
MTTRDAIPAGARPGTPCGVQRMRLRYGFNEIEAWWSFCLGEHRDRIRKHLRRMGTSVIRIFVYGKPVPDPVTQWPMFAAYVQGVLDVGAVPMITFAKFHPPHDDPRNIRTFVTRCTEIVWGCMEQWGARAVSEWYWCVWNEPNNFIIGGGLTFEQYRRIYEEVAAAILELIGPHLRGAKARIGGPAVDGTHQPFWMDWIARLVSEVDDAMVGFVSWHRYGDWRPAVPSETLGVEMHGAPQAPHGPAYERLLMAQTPTYEARARGVSRLLVGRDILNVCGEVNGISHHDHRYTRRSNQSAFGAAYYASALIHLLRGGADVEMRWTATGDDAYALLSREGEPSVACLGKELFAGHVRYGDLVHFPCGPPGALDVEAVVACADGRRSGVFVHTCPGPRTVVVSDWDETLGDGQVLLRVDESTGDRVVSERFDGTVRFSGHGVAVVTTG